MVAKGVEGYLQKKIDSFVAKESVKACPVFIPYEAARWVFPRLIKSPYKMYSLNIPYFMRVRKRFDAKKNRKIGWILDILAIFSEAWYCQNGYIPPKIHGR